MTFQPRRGADNKVVKRPTIADLAKASGVSVATVNRILGGGAAVRDDTAKRVYDAATSIGFYAAPLIKSKLREELPAVTVGFLLQRPEESFYREFSEKLGAAVAAAPAFRGTSVFDYWTAQNPDEIAERLKKLARKCQAVAFVSPDHPSVAAAVGDIRAKGIPVFALLSDCALGERTSYLGVDNRKVGRTAAWMIAKVAKPGKVAVFVGSHSFHGHESREIGLRSYFREHAPEFTVLEAIVNRESSAQTHAALSDLIAAHPDFTGCYLAGGGTDGALAALRAAAGKQSLPVTVCNHITPETRAGLSGGLLTLAIAEPLEELGRELVAAVALERGGASVPSQIFLPFGLHTPENL